jgi:hypothetical protein
VALSKLELVLVAVIAAGLIAIEREHRIVIGMPAPAEAAPPAGLLCPATDAVPLSTVCMKFVGNGTSPDIQSAPSAAADALRELPDADRSTDSSAGPACPPSNEYAPYSARCLRFISGWFWRANSQISD